MTTERDRIQHRTAAETEALRSVVVDLDAFLACDEAERGRRWRGFDHGTKFQLVAQQCTRTYGDWSEELVLAWIAKYDARWSLPPIERAVEAALERLATEHADYARTARQAGEKDDAKHFQRAANAYVKALDLYRKGVRPEPTPAGGYLLPSSRPEQPAHLLSKDGDWVCTCASGAAIHWASALVIGIEVAFDALDSGVSGESEPSDQGEEGGQTEPAPADLTVGSFIRDELLASMLDRSAARIAELRGQVTMPALAGSHESYVAIAERRRAAGRDCCGRRLTARDTRPLDLGRRIAHAREALL